jgi:hypothetical protein
MPHCIGAPITTPRSATPRELMGAGVFQMPADVSVLDNSKAGRVRDLLVGAGTIGERPHETV